ncbi:beta-galactosidase [Rubellicoccus peritrichatus]|uniref:Beta-galactosidase n=1 Tax=Rubellicoccus peritrichatus TaxID=3080537 RepID=A0AAQ3L9E5_9BACT|nr:beta-galactosidase [Puniceicoccus sp. CR14]WOO39730.1 beta-galactosidase [Puniceicoccus sp. CR14]
MKDKNKHTANRDELILGSAWYPEQWSRSIWEEDMEEMRNLGFNTARLGEFAWGKLEPSEGKYDLTWLEDALDLLYKNGIGAILCTPTAAPPSWLLKKHPEIGYVEADGYKHMHGARQHACYNNDDFRSYSRKITEIIADHFGEHPALIAWQIDNELGSHQQRSMSEASVKRWHQWLEKRYGTIEKLNEAWKTVIWSQTYCDFNDVPPPYQLTYYTHNLSLKLNYRRFMSDMIAEFQKEQIDIIKAYSDAPVTHNSTSHQDEWRLSRHLDFPSADVYTYENTREGIQYRYDLLRNLNPTAKFITMETSAEGFIDNALYREGWISCHSFINYCMGGKGFCFWPWRQQPGGAEIFHEAMLHVSGRHTSGWENAKEAVETKNLLSSVLKDYRPTRAEVALITSDYNARFSFLDRAGGIETNFDYNKRLLECYETLSNLNVWRDVILDEAAFDSYPLLYTPYLPYIRPELLEQLCTMVEDNGSTWVIGPYTGFLDQDNTIPQQAILGDLEERIGFETKNLIAAGELNVEINGLPGTTSQFAAIFEPGLQDEVIGTYTTERFKGQAWGIRRNFGKGKIYIVGSHLDDVSRHHFWKKLLLDEGIKSNAGRNNGLVEIPLTHHQPKNDAVGICNWTHSEKRISLSGKSVLAACQRTNSDNHDLTLPPLTWALVQHSNITQAIDCKDDEHVILNQ